MKRTSNFPKQTKRKRGDEDPESSMQGAKPVEPHDAPERSQVGSSANDDATSLWYSDNITAACFATNAESSRQNMLSEEQKREKRLLSNRLSARRSRERHKVEVSHLEDQSRQLSQLIETLKSENATLRELTEKQKMGVQQENDSRLSLVDLATLLQQPITGASPMDILLRARQQESNQILQSMTGRQHQHPHPLFQSLSSALSSPAFPNTLFPRPATSLPPALPISSLGGPPIPASIRHLLDVSTTWEASTASSASLKSRASKRHVPRQCDQSQDSSSSDYET
jgi:hypothetical protein